MHDRRLGRTALKVSEPGLDTMHFGPRTAAPLTAIGDVPDLALSPEMLARRDAIFSPCGPAPDAYAR